MLPSNASRSSDVESTTFRPSHVVVLSELSETEKTTYFELLLANQTLIHYDFGFNHREQDGTFVANVRLQGTVDKSSEEDKNTFAANICLQGTMDKSSEEDMSTGSQWIEQIVTSAQPERIEHAGDRATINWDDRIRRLYAPGVQIRMRVISDEVFEYDQYEKFSLLIADDGYVVKPRVRLHTWLMKTIEEVYDARYSHETSDARKHTFDDVDEKLVRTNEGPPTASAFVRTEMRRKKQEQIVHQSEGLLNEQQHQQQQGGSTFPVFVAKRLVTTIGIRQLVDSTAWDLLFTVEHFKAQCREVALFGRFLAENLSNESLLFFLLVRAIAAGVLNISLKLRWNHKVDGSSRLVKPVYLSYPQCTQVAHKVYGPSDPKMYKELVAHVLASPHLHCGAPPLAGGVDQRQIELVEFLVLAVELHRTLRGASTPNKADNRPSTERLLKSPSSSAPSSPVLPLSLPLPLPPAVSSKSPAALLVGPGFRQFYQPTLKSSQKRGDASVATRLSPAPTPGSSKGKGKSAINEATLALHKQGGGGGGADGEECADKEEAESQLTGSDAPPSEAVHMDPTPTPTRTPPNTKRNSNSNAHLEVARPAVPPSSSASPATAAATATGRKGREPASEKTPPPRASHPKPAARSPPGTHRPHQTPLNAKPSYQLPLKPSLKSPPSQPLHRPSSGSHAAPPPATATARPVVSPPPIVTSPPPAQHTPLRDAPLINKASSTQQAHTTPSRSTASDHPSPSASASPSPDHSSNFSPSTSVDIDPRPAVPLHKLSARLAQKAAAGLPYTAATEAALATHTAVSQTTAFLDTSPTPEYAQDFPDTLSTLPCTVNPQVPAVTRQSPIFPRRGPMNENSPSPSPNIPSPAAASSASGVVGVAPLHKLSARLAQKAAAGPPETVTAASPTAVIHAISPTSTSTPTVTRTPVPDYAHGRAPHAPESGPTSPLPPRSSVAPQADTETVTAPAPPRAPSDQGSPPPPPLTTPTPTPRPAPSTPTSPTEATVAAPHTDQASTPQPDRPAQATQSEATPTGRAGQFREKLRTIRTRARTSGASAVIDLRSPGSTAARPATSMAADPAGPATGSITGSIAGSVGSAGTSSQPSQPPAPAAATLPSPAASSDGGESSRQLGVRRSTMEARLLEDVFAPLLAAAAVDGRYVMPDGGADREGTVVELKGRVVHKIRDEVILQLHMKLNALFTEDEITEIDKEAVDGRIVQYLDRERESLLRSLG